LKQTYEDETGFVDYQSRSQHGASWAASTDGLPTTWLTCMGGCRDRHEQVSTEQAVRYAGAGPVACILLSDVCVLARFVAELQRQAEQTYNNLFTFQQLCQIAQGTALDTVFPSKHTHTCMHTYTDTDTYTQSP
jgi:hypothetical protein